MPTHLVPSQVRRLRSWLGLTTIAALLLATIMTLLSNLAADIAYAAIDPRITYR